MKSNGSIYVAAVFAVLFGYFAYQWWFNPSRAVKRRLGEVAAALSAPANDKDIDRIARLARLRRFLAQDVRLRAGSAGPELASRDAALAAVAGWRPSQAWWEVHFKDLHITVESESAARAYLTMELTTPDPQGRPAIDARDATVSLGRQDGEWVITAAESKDLPPPP